MSKITDKLLNRVGRGVHIEIHDELQTVSPASYAYGLKTDKLCEEFDFVRRGTVYKRTVVSNSRTRYLFKKFGKRHMRLHPTADRSFEMIFHGVSSMVTGAVSIENPSGVRNTLQNTASPGI